MEEVETEAHKDLPLAGHKAHDPGATSHKAAKGRSGMAAASKETTHSKTSPSSKSKKGEATKPPSSEGRRKSLTSSTLKGDGGTSGAAASEGRSASPHGGAGEPGSMPQMMSQMMVMMGAKGGAPAMPDMMSMMGKGLPPDLMAKMAKGGLKGGGMPDMAAMMGHGMPDMMSMFGAGGGGGMPDMMAMMGSGGPMGGMGMGGMENLMDCIIKVTFAEPESEDSEDEDSVTIELPCQHCSKFFTSQMHLKTHILIAHDHQDTSVLNIHNLEIAGKGKHGMRKQSVRKQSKDSKAASAASSPVEITAPTPITTSIQNLTSAQSSVTLPEDSSAAETEKGIKRTRSESEERDQEAVSSGAASAGAETQSAKAQASAGAVPMPDPPVVPSSAMGSPPETRKRKARLPNRRTQFDEATALINLKKSRGGSDTSKSDSDVGKETGKETTGKGSAKKSTGKETKETVAAGPAKGRGEKASQRDNKSPDGNAKHKKASTGKGEASTASSSSSSLHAQGVPAQRSKRSSLRDVEVVQDSDKDKDSGSDTQRPCRSTSRKGRQVASAVGGGGGSSAAAAVDDQSPSSATRRSLRSRKSH